MPDLWFDLSVIALVFTNIVFSYQIYKNVALLCRQKTESTRYRVPGHNDLFDDDLRLEEKYLHLRKSDPEKRKPIAKTDVELWEQERQDQK